MKGIDSALRSIDCSPDIYIWLKYLLGEVSSPPKAREALYDPLISFIFQVPHQNVTKKQIKTSIAKSKTSNELKQEIIQLFKLSDPISLQSLELARIAVNTETKPIHEQYRNDLDILIMDTIIRILYNVEDEIKNIFLSKPSKAFPPIIWMYFKNLISYVASRDEAYILDFCMISDTFFNSLLKHKNQILKNPALEPIMTMFMDIFPDLLNIMITGCSKDNYVVMTFFCDFLDYWITEIPEDFAKFGSPASHFINACSTVFEQCENPAIDEPFQTANNFLSIFKSQKIPNNIMYYRIGSACMKLQFKYNQDAAIYINNIFSYVKWVSEQLDAGLDYSIIDEEKPQKKLIYEFISIDKFFRSFEQNKVITPPRYLAQFEELFKIYRQMETVKKRSFESPALSIEIANSGIFTYKSIQERPAKQIFLSILLMMLDGINFFCIKEAIQDDFSTLIEDYTFGIDINSLSSDITKEFIINLRDETTQYFQSLIRNSKKNLTLFLDCIAHTLESKSDIYIESVMGIILGIFRAMPSDFGASIPSSDLLSFMTQYVLNNNNSTSVAIVRLIQVSLDSSPMHLLKSDQFISDWAEIANLDHCMEIFMGSTEYIFGMIAQASNEIVALVLRLLTKLFDYAKEGKSIKVSSRLLPSFYAFSSKNKSYEFHEVLKTGLLSAIGSYPAFSNNKESLNLCFSSIREIFNHFPDLISYLKSRSGKLVIGMVNSMQAYDFDEKPLDCLTAILFARPAKFGDFGIIVNNSVIPVFIDGVIGKEWELKIINYFDMLIRESRVNAYMASVGHLMTVCLRRLGNCEDQIIIDSILKVVMNLFEEYPSTMFLLQLFPAIKKGLKERRGEWPMHVLDFLRRLAMEQNVSFQQKYITLCGDGSAIFGPSLDAQDLNGVWTLSAIIKISEKANSAFPIPLFAAGATACPNLTIIIKGNRIGMTAVGKSGSILHTFDFDLNNTDFYLVQLKFAEKTITLSINGQDIETIARLHLDFKDTVMTRVGRLLDDRVKRKPALELMQFVIQQGQVSAEVFDHQPTVRRMPQLILGYDFATATDRTVIAYPMNIEILYTGVLVKPSADFPHFFTEEGTWNSFFMIFFGAASATRETGSDEAFQMLPQIMSAIIEKNPDSEAALSGLNGFQIISDFIIKERPVIQEGFVNQMIGLAISLKTKEAFIKFAEAIWMNANVILVVPQDLACKFALCVIKAYEINPEAMAEVFSRSLLVEYFIALGTLSKLLPGEIELVSKNIIDVVLIAAIKMKSSRQFQTILKILMTDIPQTVFLAILDFTETMLKSNNEIFVSSLDGVAYYSPFLQLLHNKNNMIRRKSLRCLQMISIVTGAETSGLQSAILSLTESVTNFVQEATDLFTDCYDHIFGFYRTQFAFNAASQQHNDEANIRSFPIRSPEFLPLFAATSTKVDPELVSRVLSQFSQNIIENKEDGASFVNVPMWPYWILLLCHKADISVFSPIADVTLSPSQKEGDFEPTRNALNVLETVEEHFGIDLTDLRKDILMGAAQNVTGEAIIGFSKSVFGFLFTRFTKRSVPEEIELKPLCLSIKILAKTEERMLAKGIEEIEFSMRVVKDWLDSDLAVTACEALSKAAFAENGGPLVSLAKNAQKLPIIVILAYITSYLMRFPPKDIAERSVQYTAADIADEFANGVYEWARTISHEEKHLTAALIVRQQSLLGITPNEELMNYFLCYDDERDSPEYQYFMFEEFLVENRKEILFTNLF